MSSVTESLAEGGVGGVHVVFAPPTPGAVAQVVPPPPEVPPVAAAPAPPVFPPVPDRPPEPILPPDPAAPALPGFGLVARRLLGGVVLVPGRLERSVRDAVLDQVALHRRRPGGGERGRMALMRLGVALERHLRLALRASLKVVHNQIQDG